MSQAMNPDKLRYMSADPEMYREELRQPAAPSTPAPAQPPQKLNPVTRLPDTPLGFLQAYMSLSMARWEADEIPLDELCLLQEAQKMTTLAASAPKPEEWLHELLSFPIEHRASCAVGVGPGRNCDCGLIEILEKARAYRASLSAKEKRLGN